MTETKIVLSDSCEFVFDVYDNDERDASLDYVEHACDYWSSDTHTSINIKKEKAIELVNALKNHFGI